MAPITRWPKQPPPLTAEQQAAREKFMLLWHQTLPQKYGLIERFNHGFPAALPHKPNTRTLEIGAGIGAHAEYERLDDQEYHCLEFREEFCKELRKKMPADRVVCGDVQKDLPWPPLSFDRIVVIHVLEHLVDLPTALDQISRVLRDDGNFDLVIPCEGGLAYSLARKISAERLFRKHFGMDYGPIIKNEHVNTCREILDLLRERFRIERQRFFPLVVPSIHLNLCIGFRLTKREERTA